MFVREFVEVLKISNKLCYTGKAISYFDKKDKMDKYAAIPNDLCRKIDVGDMVEIVKSEGLSFDGYGAMVIG